MSNLSGNYKIHAGEVQGVDVVREQERRARLQLLDEIREPSPQPIFGEPVKVELEDETARRIKNTLGDVDQVLKHDSKNLLGISRSSSSTAGYGGSQCGRNQPTSKRPPIQNGMYKPCTNVLPKYPVSDKRLGYPRNKPHEPVNCPPNLLHTDSRSKDQWERFHQQRKPGVIPSTSGNSQSYTSNPSLCPNVPSNKSYPYIYNGVLSNTVMQAPRYGETFINAAPPKRFTFRPSSLKLPERKPEKPAESPKRDELETILREMKQAVPPLLTAIQTPRTDESGFTFPDPKEEDLLNAVQEIKLDTNFSINTHDVVPQSPEPPKQKEANSRQSTPSPLLKKTEINMPAVVDSLDKLDPGQKEPEIYKLGIMPQKTDSYAAEPEVMDIISHMSETKKATELLESLLNEPDKCISSSLQADLAMSDSDEEVVTEVKDTQAKISLDIAAVVYPKSPIIPSTVNSMNSSTVVNNSNMNVPQSVPSNSSSSSESGDSDSDDSSSESNSSDSSTSSSDADTPSKMWGLSNFFDDTRRNHSPAFVPMDTSTNSSTTAVKEDPMVAPQGAREGYSLVDEDSVNGILREYANDLKDYLNVPITDNIPKFLELDPSVNIKNEILSPIASPLHPLGPPAPPPPLPPPPPPPPPQIIRGPRTPPSPSYAVTDELVTVNKNCTSSGNNQIETSVTAEQTVPQSQTNKHSAVLQNSCDKREESGKVQMTTAKKRLSKNKSEIFSPRTDSSPVTQSFEDDEPSASKGLPDVSLDKDENDSVALTSSNSVPSETSESSHKNYSIKTRQKVSKSSNTKKSKTLSEESLCESGQKGSSALKSPVAPKFKQPTRTCRVSNDTKQLSKVGKGSTKLDQPEGIKKPPAKSDLKDKSSPEKNKSILKTVGNLKGLSKNSVKIKKKPSKMPPKLVSDCKKGEIKRKKSKFHIENFLQSPTVSQSENLHPKVATIVSPSRDRSPIPDYKNLTDNKRRPSSSPSRASRSPSRSSSKSVERVKSGEKLRRSTRCSERASSAQTESSAAANQDSDVAKKSVKRTPKLREHADDSLIHVEAPPSLLSPIPHNSPIPMTLSECAIPIKIIVSIPLDKLTRLPATVHTLDTDNKPASKRSRQGVDESIQKKNTVLLEKSSKNVSNKRSVSKDIKDKPRTDPSSKNNKSSKCVSVTKKDKNVKTISEPSLTAKPKTSSSVNNKNSIKSTDGKASWDPSENKVSKKRKNEETKQSPKKKSKLYPVLNQDRHQQTTLRTESPSNLVASTSKSKSLERCDSVSSLSSLSSQISQRSSKGKRSSTMSDAKRGKTTTCPPVKHIKQEKEERVKTTIKKEPGTPDKSKEKSRDKILSKDVDCNEKSMLDPLWNDTSSQYSPWGDPCKDDSKGSLPIATTMLDSLNRPCGLDWDSLDIKDLKEASNLKQSSAPITPMDYYYTEGRKQRHLAEREKDPFLQSVKYFEATVLFILTSQQREEYTKEPESVYQFYRETLNFSNLIIQNVRIQHASPGSLEFKLLILLLRCQALLHVKLYNLKIKEIKEQQKSVSDFFLLHCPATVRSLSNPTPSNPRLSLPSIPSPHSPTPSPASSVNSQTSGYSSSDVSCSHRNPLPPFSPSVNVTQNMIEMICRQHTHLTNLHMGHDLWEQADMYMTRSNLREFFKEVADQSENLTLHSSIKDLVNYVQTGISIVKKSPR